MDPTAEEQVTLASIALTKATFLHESLLVSLSGMVETPRLQAKQIFHCRGATCHSGESRNPGKMGIGILDAPGLPIAGAGLSSPA